MQQPTVNQQQNQPAHIQQSTPHPLLSAFPPSPRELSPPIQYAPPATRGEIAPSQAASIARRTQPAPTPAEDQGRDAQDRPSFTNLPPPTIPDPSFDWKFTFSAQHLRDLEVLDDACLDHATLKRIRSAVGHAAFAVRRKLNGKEPTAVNMLKLMWPREVLCRLADDFQLQDSGLESEPTFGVWTSFLSVILKGCFYNCASFSEMYSFKKEYGDTNALLPEETFMAMKRGLSCSKTPGDDQRVLNGDYDLEAGEDRTKDLETWEALVTKLSYPFVPRAAAFMIDDDHFETQADPGALATQKNPKKGRSGPLADAMCVADIRLITAVSVRRRESNALVVSVLRLINRLDGVGKKPRTIFFDRGYSLMNVIAALHSEGVSVFGTARDFELHTNKHGPFIFKDNKDGPTQLYKHTLKREARSTTPQIYRHFVAVSGRGSALEISAEAFAENLVAVGRRNGGQAGTGITVIFSADLEGSDLLPGCKRWTIVVQPESSKQARRDPSAASRLSYKESVKRRVLEPLSREGLRQVTGAQTTEDWYLMRFGRVTSTGAVRVLAVQSAIPTVREEAGNADAVLQSAGLRQQGTTAPSGVLERLIAVWLMRPLGGGRVGEALRMGRINEPKTAANLPIFLMDCVRGDDNAPHHYFAGNYDIGLVTRKCTLPANVAPETALDRSFDVLAASVDGMAVLLDVRALQSHDAEAFKHWKDFSEGRSTNDVHMSRLGTAARSSVMTVAAQHPEVFVDVAVEIKTATAPNTVDAARTALCQLQGTTGSQKDRTFWNCAFGDSVYSRLVPSEHRTQLKHHVAVLGISNALYVKSTAEGILYAVNISYPSAVLTEHIDEVVKLVAPHVCFLYMKQQHVIIPAPADNMYRHAQDRDGFIYSILLWRSVDKHIRERGFYENGASVTPGPHSLWPKVKPYVDVMSRYLTHIEAGRGSNLNLSQFITLRFLNYLVYNAYVLHRVMAVEESLDTRRQGGSTDAQVLTVYQRIWKARSLRGFVADLNDTIRQESPSVLLPDVFGTSLPAVADEEDEDSLTALEVAPVSRKPWPKRNRRRLADEEEWRAQRLSKEWPHEMRQGKVRPCVACTTYVDGRPTKKPRSSSYVCSGCDDSTLCIKPPADGRRKSCWVKWHSNLRINL